jgi:hypothetical protein
MEDDGLSPTTALGPLWVGHWRRVGASVLVDLPPGLVDPRVELRCLEDAVRRVRVDMTAYVLGQRVEPARYREVVREPATWVQHWKLSRRWWTTCLDRHPLASWAKAHPRAGLVLRNPLGRWALRRPLVLWLNRRHPVRYRYRTVEVELERWATFPRSTLRHPPDLGRPVMIQGLGSSIWSRGRPYDLEPTSSKDS